MTLELLEEIHILQDDLKSNKDIALSLCISEKDIYLMLRMEKIFLSKYESLLDDNKIFNETIANAQSQIDSLNIKLQNKDDIIENLKTIDIDDFQNKINSLQTDLETQRILNLHDERKARKYEEFPNIVKRWF